MIGFDYLDGELRAENTPLADIAARYGTPTYVYSRKALTQSLRAFQDGCAGRRALICYAVKANSNIAIIDLFARLGAGFDIVSGGELQRVLAMGVDSRKIVFSGVGKTEAEMVQALNANILCFNVESGAELERLARVASEQGRVARVSLRVNPDVDAKTHPYIATGLKENKFGVAYEEALRLYRWAARQGSLAVVGIDCHIGSQLTEVAPFLEALDKILLLKGQLKDEGVHIEHLDLGGGLGIRYRDEEPPAVGEYLRALFARLPEDPELTVLFEPGRALVGNSGVLLTKVEYIKRGPERNFAVVDAAMNDLMRPALYDAWHDLWPLRTSAAASARYEVVGPVCESGDFLARSRDLAIAQGDLLAIMSAGAYGMSMSSNYNTRPRACEVMVDDRQAYCIRERESTESLWALERRLP